MDTCGHVGWQINSTKKEQTLGGQIAIVPPPLRGAALWQWLGQSHKAR